MPDATDRAGSNTHTHANRHRHALTHTRATHTQHSNNIDLLDPEQVTETARLPDQAEVKDPCVRAKL